MGSKMSGFDEFSRELKKLSQNAKELDGQHQIPLSELFNDGFMRKYTNVSTIDEFFVNSGFKVETEEDILAIPDEEFDKYVVNVTRFNSFSEMQEQAVGDYVAKKLGF